MKRQKNKKENNIAIKETMQQKSIGRKKNKKRKQYKYNKKKTMQQQNKKTK